MAWHKKQTQKKKRIEKEEGLPQEICGDFHVVLAARVTALLGVSHENVPRIMRQAHAAARTVSPEHPDVRVLRSVWEMSLPYASDTHVSDDELSFWAIPDRALRVMTALRVVDRIPYETLAAVWRAHTPQRIAQDIAAACHQLYRVNAPATHIAQSDFVQVWRLADAQMSMAQIMYVREDLSAQAAAGWAFYDTLRGVGMRIGTAAVVQYIQDAQPQSVLRQMTQDNSAYLPEATVEHKNYNFSEKLPKTHCTQGSSTDMTTPDKGDSAQLSLMRRLGLFAGMVIVTILLVFCALFILAQFGTDVSAPSDAELQAHGLGAVEDAVVAQRSPQEVMQSLEAHLYAAADDVPESILAEDATMTALATDSEQAIALLEHM